MLRPLFLFIYLQCYSNCEYHNYRFGLFEDKRKTKTILTEEFVVISQSKLNRKWNRVKGHYAKSML